jgi:hypothetical protein
MASHRSIGLSLLSLGFLALTVGAFRYANRAVANPGQLARLGVNPPLVIALAAASGIAAACVTIAAWIRSGAVRGLIVAWSVTVGAAMIAFQTGTGRQGEPLWLVLFPYVGLGILTWALVKFAGRRA